MQDIHSIPALEVVLNDLSLHPIVRHEAAEALGAIGLECVIPILKSSLTLDPAQEVRETCELALSRIEEMTNSVAGGESSLFLSVDPAAPASCSSVKELREILLNENKCMYEQYAALFALRNLGDNDAISAIIESLGAKSALLRHEVAYVLGQLQNKKASDALSQVLRDVHEHPMVRHEAAEALGSIAVGVQNPVVTLFLNLHRVQKEGRKRGKKTGKWGKWRTLQSRGKWNMQSHQDRRARLARITLRRRILGSERWFKLPNLMASCLYFSFYSFAHIFLLFLFIINF